MNKIIAIGDIHGHDNQLVELMYRLANESNFKEDTFVFLGDYVDGGPDTKKVLDRLMGWKEEFPHWKFLKGNHEDLLLDAFDPKHPVYGDYYLWWNQGGKETLDSFKPPTSLYSDYERSIMQPKDLITSEYMDFISNLDIFYETPEYFFVHGGVHPGISLKDQTVNLGDGKEGSNRYDMIWNRDFIGSDYDWGKKIIYGHTATKDYHPRIHPNMIGIDTMMHNTGRLTAVVLPSEEFIFSDFAESDYGDIKSPMYL